MPPQAKKLWARRADRAARWDAAFEVLAAELASLKAAMRAFTATRVPAAHPPAPVGSDNRPIAAQ